MSKRIPLTQGKFAIVDDADYEYLSRYKWCVRKSVTTWYAVRAQWQDRKYVRIIMHREILKPPTGMETDHKDGDGLNNQRSNLRAATRAQNQHNRRKQEGTTSQYKGVSWHRGAAKWRARIWVDGRVFFLGYFFSEGEAAKAYDVAAVAAFGEFAHTNF